jgi:MarR family transcriptional regulator for hemolysin
MENQDKPLGMVIGKMMKETLRVLIKRAELKTETNITKEQFWLLHTINKVENEVIQKDMAEIMGKDKSSILRMIDSLEKKDLVRRVVDLNDRRKNRIMLSKKGERVIAMFLNIEIELTNELIEGISHEDWDTFNRVVEHIQNKAQSLQI